ncbi:MAG: cytochrome c oxidase accessory protein CcoG [Myxococcaceae bacterium]|nr:cytochrome c oxidase accessory protein CcoG [Myxococcaceae bacterium]
MDATRSNAPAAQLSSIRADGSRLAIHPADVRGRFIRARRIVFVLLIAFYVAAPLLSVAEHPAIHLDVAARHFYLFGRTFNAQDFWLVVPAMLSFTFGLLFVTAWRGRVWCGWACPQTVFLEALYRPIERLLEGSRERRLRAQNEPLTPGRAGRKAVKHVLYVAISIGIAHVSLALFLSAAQLRGMVLEGPTAHPVPFAWAMALSALFYFNFGWFREQFCVVLCPYGRMQSVMHDRDSVLIAYDAKRGEPRGPLRKQAAAAAQTGDCVDCKKCVYACPTAIDIRNGLQMECLACAQCIDACDEVMDKIGKPQGLIRYASLRELDGAPRKVLRPRLVIYGLLFFTATTTLAASLWQRSAYEANIVRPAGLPYLLSGDSVVNQLQVHLANKTAQTLVLRVRSQTSIRADVRVTTEPVIIAPMSLATVPVGVVFARKDWGQGAQLVLRFEPTEGGEVREQAVRLLAPP